MHPHHLHALRIDPSKLDSVRLDRLWAGMADADAEAMQGVRAWRLACARS